MTMESTSAIAPTRIERLKTDLLVVLTDLPTQAPVMSGPMSDLLTGREVFDRAVPGTSMVLGIGVRSRAGRRSIPSAGLAVTSVSPLMSRDGG
jgi:hypothetical protein